MFKHILLPTDGSPLSDAAIAQGVQLAREIGATITGFHAIPEFRVFTSRPEMLEDTKQRFLEDCRTHAREYLAVLETAAKEAGVPCDTVVSVSDEPYLDIIQAAEQKGCDLIAMAGHGHRLISDVIYGATITKVRHETDIPLFLIKAAPE